MTGKKIFTFNQRKTKKHSTWNNSNFIVGNFNFVCFTIADRMMLRWRVFAIL